MSSPRFDPLSFSGLRVAVLGLAATGVSVARVAHARGASVVVSDDQSEKRLPEARLAAVQSLGNVGFFLGGELPDFSKIDLVVPSPGVPEDSPLMLAARGAGCQVWSEIEVAYRICRAPILAVTGTNGKTTTVAMLASAISAGGCDVVIAGNFAADSGVRYPLIDAADTALATSVIVAEVSSFQLEQTEAFAPRGAAWLNLSVDHQDRYADMEAYGRAKARIVAAQDENACCALNADDPWVVSLAKDLGRGRRLWFSGRNPVLPPELDLSPTDLLLPGSHNLANACAASRLALDFGIAPEDVASGLAGFTGVAHRMERVAEIDGVVFINNSMCTNPAAVAASLNAVSGSVIAIAGGRHKGGDIREMALALARTARAVVLIGEHGPLLAASLAVEGFRECVMAGDMADAVAKAKSLARVGDTVLLAPGFASFDMYTGFEQRGQAFRDAVASFGGEERKP